MESLQTIAVFCGSRVGQNSAYREAAVELGKLLGERRIGLVYGGASMGLMGAIADAVLEHGGQVTGVIPESLKEKELAHSGLSKLCIVASMHERKAMMERLSQGFIALPGGIGTLEEIFEILTWAQLGLHQKPCGLLNVNGYYDGLISFLKTMECQGFLGGSFDKRLLLGDRAGPLLDQLSAALESNLEDTGKRYCTVHGKV